MAFLVLTLVTEALMGAMHAWPALVTNTNQLDLVPSSSMGWREREREKANTLLTALSHPGTSNWDTRFSWCQWLGVEDPVLYGTKWLPISWGALGLTVSWQSYPERVCSIGRQNAEHSLNCASFTGFLWVKMRHSRIGGGSMSGVAEHKLVRWFSRAMW